MKRIKALLLALTITGCASTQTYHAAPQFYRAKGQDDQIQISGQVKQDYEYKITGDKYANRVTITFNGTIQIDGLLDARGFGEFSGQPFQEKPTSASCSSKPVSKGWVELKCIVFIDNERAATLTM